MACDDDGVLEDGIVTDAYTLSSMHPQRKGSILKTDPLAFRNAGENSFRSDGCIHRTLKGTYDQARFQRFQEMWSLSSPVKLLG